VGSAEVRVAREEGGTVILYKISVNTANTSLREILPSVILSQIKGLYSSLSKFTNKRIDRYQQEKRGF
jgi:hypothetical protein